MTGCTEYARLLDGLPSGTLPLGVTLAIISVLALLVAAVSWAIRKDGWS